MNADGLQRPGVRSRRALAIAGARAAALGCSWLGRGGTSLPGLVALWLDGGLVAGLGAELGGGSLLVAGTNGKTTTAALAAEALRAAGRRVLHNRSGSNMLRGLAATLARTSTLSGHLRDGRHLTGLFEVDEAALPGVLRQLSPRALLLTNLFRDQLDRYGELATVAGHWRGALQRLPASTTLVLNADDPLVAALRDATPGPALLYGVDGWDGEERAPESRPAGSADSLYCPRCGAPLRFAWLAYAHLGAYSCPACGLRRPEPAIRARVCASGTSSTIQISDGSQTVDLRLDLPGRYNAYNAVAAVALATAAGVPLAVAGAAVADARGVFGRAEVIQAGDRDVRLYLIKNPTGADEVLRVVAGGDRGSGLLVLLSDLAADGHDISWIWDVQWEALESWRGPVYCGGSRAEDMALRLKYAGLPTVQAVWPGDVRPALRRALAATPGGGCLVVLATYTAMLGARDALARAGHIRQYWEKGT